MTGSIKLPKRQSYASCHSRTKSIITESEILDLGANLSLIDRWVESGLLYPSAAGIYMPNNVNFTEQYFRVKVAARLLDAVMCLATALNFHRITTQMPHKVWIAHQSDTPQPIEPKLPIKTILMSCLCFDWGIEVHQLEGIQVKVYSIAKTMADCFVYQEQIGSDVAIKAFEQSIQENRCTVADILDYIGDRMSQNRFGQNIRSIVT